MKCQIELNTYKGFRWNHDANFHFIGYFNDIKFTWETVKYFLTENIDNKKLLLKYLKSLNGFFACIIEKNNKIYIFSDKVRSFPVYYSSIGNSIFISDNPDIFINEFDMDNENCRQFMLSGFVVGNHTLLNSVYQIQAGEYIVIDKETGKPTPCCYFEFRHSLNMLYTTEKYVDLLNDAVIDTFNRLILTLGGRPVCIPLSGGQDSRLIAVMLKKLGYQNVTCFSYGVKGNDESKVSKTIADKLGYTWYFIEYTPEKWKKFYNSHMFKEFIKFGSGISSLACVQQTVALQELVELGKIAHDTLFIPGHAGDFIAGSHIPSCTEKEENFDLQMLLNTIYDKHFHLDQKMFSASKSHIVELIKNEISIKENYNSDEFADEVELFDWKERQSKFIVNDVRNYEFFNFEWRLPLWDSKLIDFWCTIPLDLRIGRNLYFHYAQKYIDPYINLYIDYFKNLQDDSSLKKTVKRLIKGTFLKNIYYYKNAIMSYFLNPLCFYKSFPLLKYCLALKKIGYSADLNSFLSKYYVRLLKSKQPDGDIL